MVIPETLVGLLIGIMLFFLAWEMTMGIVLPPMPFQPNLDKNGMPLDYATYVWQLYGRVVEDKSPQRRAFLNAPTRPDPGRRETR